MTRITDVSVRSVDAPLDESFETAVGTRKTAENLFVRVETASGAVGAGEASPLPSVTGATRGAAVALVRDAVPLVQGRESGNYRGIVDDLHEAVPGMVPVASRTSTWTETSVTRDSSVVRNRDRRSNRAVPATSSYPV